jgi:hypothetical protein
MLCSIENLNNPRRPLDQTRQPAHNQSAGCNAELSYTVKPTAVLTAHASADSHRWRTRWHPGWQLVCCSWLAHRQSLLKLSYSSYVMHGVSTQQGGRMWVPTLEAACCLRVLCCRAEVSAYLARSYLSRQARILARTWVPGIGRMMARWYLEQTDLTGRLKAWQGLGREHPP